MKKNTIAWLVLLFLLLSVSISEASIALKVIAANPSKTQEQKVQVKAYLPKEIKPEDVLAKSDLDIAYDTQQGSYYVYGEYDLKPGEMLEKEIEMKDIWLIPSAEIESFRIETAKVADLLKGTEFSDRIVFLKNSIDGKLNQIVENQKASPANPERHISDYRENLRLLESVKADLALARSLMSQAKPMPMASVWRIITWIIIFLGILGASFYFIMQRQVKVITQDTFSGSKDEAEPQAARAKKHEAEQVKKKLEPGEIKKILDEKKEEEI